MALNLKDEDIIQAFLKNGAEPNTKCSESRHSMRYDGNSSWYPIHRAVEAR